MPSPDTEPRKLAAILFTDMVGSTALKQRLGDKAGLQLIQQHHELLRHTLQQFPGAPEINTAGDSFFLSFPTPSAAVSFALLFQARLRQFNVGSETLVQDRVGIHLGEVTIEGGEQTLDLHGLNVDLCARVMSLARGGQILLTRAVFDSARQVLKGEDLEGVGQLNWLSHGRYQLQGIDEPVEICEVGEAGSGVPAPPETSDKAKRHAVPEEEPVLGWRPALGQAVPNTKWVLEQKLGEGGFGEVWLGRHQTMKERRVFKFCFRADRVRSLKREMTLFRLIKERIGDHPNIVALREVCFDAPPFYVEMDYVAGQDLRTWCEAQGGVAKVPLATKLEIVAQIADALQAAHDAGVIHRDVKPGNILVSGEWRVASGEQGPAARASTDSSLVTGHSSLLVKLTDFGIGQVVSQEYLAGVTKAGFTQTLLSSSSSQTGTQLYMAPELLAGRPASTRSDIYSLGVALFQLLRGDFTKPVTIDWAKQIADPSLREDLEHCLMGEPNERFAGAAQLASNLRHWEQRRAALERQRVEQAERERLRRQAEHRRRVLVAGAAAALVLAALASALGYGLLQARAERERQRRFAYAADMALAGQALAVNNVGRVEELLNRHRPKPGQADLRGWEWRYLWQQCRNEAMFTLCQKSNMINSLSASGDGRFLAVTELGAGGLSIWDLRTRKEIVSFPVGLSLARFSPGGSLLAFSDTTNITSKGPQESRIRFWDGTAGKLLDAALAPVDWYAEFRFTDDGHRLFTYASFYNRPDRFDLWRVPECTSIRGFGEANISGNVFGFPLALAGDLSLLAYAANLDRTNFIVVEQLPDRQVRWRAKSTDESFVAIAFSPDGKILATSSGLLESVIRLWDAATGKEIGRPLEGHRAYVSDLLFWPDGKTLASASADQTIRLWDIRNPAEVQPVRVLHGHSLEVRRLTLLPDGKTLVSGSKDGSVRVWDTTAASRESGCTVLDAGRADYRQFLPESICVFEPESRSVITVQWGTRLERWEGTQFRERETVMEFGTNFCGCVLSEDARRAAIGYLDGSVKIWDLAQRAELRTLRVSTGAVTPVRFLAQGTKLLIRSGSPELESNMDEWDTATERLTRSWPKVKSIGTSFSRDERFWLSFWPDAIVLRDRATGRESRIALDTLAIKEPTDAALSPDGKLFAVASRLGYAKIWETATRREIATLRGFLLGARAVCFSPDGKRLAVSGNGREAIKLWDLESRQELLTLEGHGAQFDSPAFSPDGNVLWTANARRQMHLWRAPSWGEIQAAEQAGVAGPQR